MEDLRVMAGTGRRDVGCPDHVGRSPRSYCNLCCVRIMTRPSPRGNGIPMDDNLGRLPGRRPGGRTARVREAVLDATLAELAGRGYAGLTVEGVAARSGVHKTTVYRRWGGVEGLIADALDRGSRLPWPVPDTGTVRGDL